MKVSAIANAYEQYNMYKKKLDKDLAAYDDYRIFDEVYNDSSTEQRISEARAKVERDKKQLIKFLNTDIDKLPKENPLFKINEETGNVLDVKC